MRLKLSGARTLLLIVLVLTPAISWAQSATTGAIAGVVRDATGAVLPGVTVEAASPALIEKVRVVVSDDQGNYKIVDLRPGTYTVTFTLPGFSTFKREGIELTTGFTATANAEMKVGALEETVTVTGASPVVDIQNVRSQNVLSRTAIDALPTGKTIQGFVALTLGATSSAARGQDVGGNKGEMSTHLAIHGTHGNDGRLYYDGMTYNSNHSTAGGQMRTYMLNQVGVQEITLETSGISAESETGGVNLNAVPKDGGNILSLYLAAAYTNENLATGKDFPEKLLARGLTSQPTTKAIWDYGIGVGGPIKKDRLWFYSPHRWWGAQSYSPGVYFDKVHGDLFYTPDLSRPAYTDSKTNDSGIRLTWQAAEKHKVTGSYNLQYGCECWAGTQSNNAPEAVANQDFGPMNLAQVSWSYAATNRLLFQAGASFGHFLRRVQPLRPRLLPESISVLELSTGLRYGAPAGGDSGVGLEHDPKNRSDNYNQRFSVSYVTGSHAFKTGLYHQQGLHDEGSQVNNNVSYTFRFQVPVALTQWAYPDHRKSRIRNVGLFVQDQWTVRRLTMNLGVRFNYFNGHTLAQHLPASTFVPARDFPAVQDVPNWKDLDPRVGAAYDLFGNGKTAVKVSLGRYVGSMGVGVTEPNHPARQIVVNATRTWNDANGNYVPDCDLQNRGTNGECGALDNQKFGTVGVTTRWSRDALEGWGVRNFHWQTSASVQHELRPGLGLTVGYYRTWYGGFTATVNQAVTPADYDSYCITASSDPRLPGGGGNRICGLYDIKPAKFGLVDNVIVLSSDFGNQTEIFNGVDVGVNARFGRDGRGLLQGGVTVGRTVTDTCYQNDLPHVQASSSPSSREPIPIPRTSEFCRVAPPWWSGIGSQAKLAAVYPLPWSVETSAVFQHLPGVAQSGNLAATNAQIAPSLGRNLAAGANATAIVDVLPFNTHFEDRITQLDLRFTKLVRMGRARVQGMFDVFNVFNARAVLAVNPRFGPTFLQPQNVMASRMFKFGAQVDF